MSETPMYPYAVRRILQSDPILFVVFPLVFFIVRVFPGDPARPGIPHGRGHQAAGLCDPPVRHGVLRRRRRVPEPCHGSDLRVHRPEVGPPRSNGATTGRPSAARPPRRSSGTRILPMDKSAALWKESRLVPVPDIRPALPGPCLSAGGIAAPGGRALSSRRMPAREKADPSARRQGAKTGSRPPRGGIRWPAGAEAVIRGIETVERGTIGDRIPFLD